MHLFLRKLNLTDLFFPQGLALVMHKNHDGPAVFVMLNKALEGLALVMHKNHEGPAVFVMLNKALEIAQREKRVIEERNIRILIAQMHVVKVTISPTSRFSKIMNWYP